jgi:pimeloyl-ACP methyl ester carboxylesterase
VNTQSASNLNWIEVGNTTSDTTIIFLHEGLGCIEMWRDYPKQLCIDLGVRGIVYDRAGYGKSTGSLLNRTNLYLHEAADELAKLITALKIQYPILYGHSDGGSIALIYAANHPDKVKAVITEAAHVFNETGTIKGVREARPWMEEGKMEGLRKYHGDRYQEVFYAWNDIWLDDSFMDWDITDLLPSINCPQLIIQGKDDQYGTLLQVETIAKMTTGETSTFTPENCGHAPFKEQREKVMEMSAQFIEQI